jgi:RibD C-terminal domain
VADRAARSGETAWRYRRRCRRRHPGPSGCGLHCGAVGVGVGDDDVAGTPAGVGVEDQDDADTDGGPEHLHADERRRRAGRDTGERVSEHPAHRDRGVGERGGAGEPVRGADVGADRWRGQQAASRAGQGEDQRDQAGGGDNLAEVAAALDATDKDVSIGGAGLAAAAIELGLVDELRMFRNPVVVGGGTPFLPPVTEDVRLDLIETRTFGSRVIYERYGRARAESDRHRRLSHQWPRWFFSMA